MKLNKFVVELIKPISARITVKLHLLDYFLWPLHFFKRGERWHSSVSPQPPLLSSSAPPPPLPSSLSPSFSQRDSSVLHADKHTPITHTRTRRRLRNKILMMVSKRAVFLICLVQVQLKCFDYAIQHMPACGHVYTAYERDKNG